MMRTLVIICYVLAGVFAFLALFLLLQVFVARQTVENVTLGYRMMLGATGPRVDRLLASLVSGVRTLFCLSSMLLSGVAVVIFALGRLMTRLNQQSLRIRDLEAQLADKSGEAPAITNADNP